MRANILSNFSLVIPAYNEEKRIRKVLETYTKSLEGLNYEIIVVCNGCRDRTEDIVRDFVQKNHLKNLRVLVFKEKLGKGGAVIQGFKVAKGKFMGFVDADLSTSPQEFLKLVRILEKEKLDGVIGSRKIKGAKILIPQPFFRRFASKCFNIIVRALFGLPFKDTQCGAKVFNAEAIKSILTELKLKGFEFDVEILWRLKKRGFRVKEVPIVWKHEKGSSFSLKNSPKMLINLIRLRFNI